MIVRTAFEKPSYSFSISVKRRIRLSSAPTSMVSFTRVSPAAAAFFRRSSIRRLWPAIILPTAAASSWASSRARRLVLASCSVCARRVRTAACSASTAAFRSASCPLSAAMAAASVRASAAAAAAMASRPRRDSASLWAPPACCAAVCAFSIKRVRAARRDSASSSIWATRASCSSACRDSPPARLSVSSSSWRARSIFSR